MIAHLWELRADVAPLEAGARQWARVVGDLARTADDLVDAARHALDQGWESESAESYELHRRQIVQQIDTFTTVAERIRGSLAALAGMLVTAQEELDRSWLQVSVVPHDLVGAERVLVLHPATPGDEELVSTATATAKEIRARLGQQLYDEATRLRESRMELSTVRSDLVQAATSAWPGGVVGGVTAGAAGVSGDVSTGLIDRGVDGVVGGAHTTSVAGASAGGAAAAVPALPPIAPISVSTPDLTGLSAAALAAGAGVAGAIGAAAAKRGPRRDEAAPQGTGMAPMGGMAAGAAMRGGTLGRSGGSGGSARTVKPTLPDQEPPEERAARVAREKERAREAKRQLLEQRQAERAARRAQREGSQQREPEPEARPVIEVVEVAPGEHPPARRG